MTAPISLCIFNRPQTTLRVFETIRHAKPERLFVFADGPRPNRPDDVALCQETRRIVGTVDWPCELHTEFADTNMGLARRMFSGISWVFRHVDEAIILEDDCVPSPSFFPFCTELLSHYHDDTRLTAVSGDNFQYRNTCGPYSYYFSRYPHCWGWATWRRAWQLLDFDMPTWPEARSSGWVREWFSDPLSADFWEKIFDAVYQGKINSWAYRYIYTCFLHNGLTALPAINLVSNVGFDDTATHCRRSSPLANLPAQDMTWPLRHPPYVFRSRMADTYSQEAIYEDRLPVRRVLVNARAIARENSSYGGDVNRQMVPQPGGCDAPAWAVEMAGPTPEDHELPSDLASPNLCLNRARLARFLADFAGDSDVRDFIALDSIANVAGLPIHAGGRFAITRPLSRDAVRLWEQLWLYKTLALNNGGHDLLDVGGALSHLTVLAAAAGNRVTVLENDSSTALAARQCFGVLGLSATVLHADTLDGLQNQIFDRVTCSSYLQHISTARQSDTITTFARVLRPGGIIGLTYDYGQPAPGANVCLPPPHEPPQDAEDVRRRYVVGGLSIVGPPFQEDPRPGSLYYDTDLQHSVAALFLGKPPLAGVFTPTQQRLPVSALSSLNAPEVLYRAFRIALEWEENTTRSFSRLQRAEIARTEMEAIAEERLVALNELDAALRAEKQQREIHETAAEERLRALIETDAALRAERAAREAAR